MESWKTLAVPWKVPVMVAGRLAWRRPRSHRRLAQRRAGLQREGKVTEGNWPECGILCGPASSTSLATAFERHQLARVRFQVDHLQAVGVPLILGQHLQQHAVLIGGRVDGGGQLRPESVVERRWRPGIQFSCSAAARSRSSTMLTRGILDLQIAGDVLQARDAGA